MLNFTYVVKKPQDGTFGNILDNGAWTGMISELQTQKADLGKLQRLVNILKCNNLNPSKQIFLAFTAIAMSFERSEAISFLNPLFKAQTQLFIEYPKNVRNYYSYVQSFTWYAWLWIIIFAMVVAPVFLFITVK